METMKLERAKRVKKLAYLLDLGPGLLPWQSQPLGLNLSGIIIPPDHLRDPLSLSQWRPDDLGNRDLFNHF